MKIDWARNETLVFLVVVGFCALTTAVDSAFFSVPTLFDLLRNSIVLGIFAIGVLVVLVSGGIDVSFTAIAAFSMYSTTLMLVKFGLDVPWYAIFVMSVVIGTGLGLINAVFIAGFRLPTLIVTLGTLSVFRGFLLTFVGSQLISNVPASMRNFSRMFMIRGTNSEGYFFSLPWAFVALVLVVVGTWFLLHRTLLGRQIYAIGGSTESARRIGVNVRGVQIFVYAYVGGLAGLAGIIHASLARVANPFDLDGLDDVGHRGRGSGRGAAHRRLRHHHRHAARRGADRAGIEQPDPARHSLDLAERRHRRADPARHRPAGLPGQASRAESRLGKP